MSVQQAMEGRISYAQCWEDPRVLVEGCRVGPEDDVLSICSAGDNAFALAIAGARSVTCVDFSFPQLALAELKLTAVRLLPVQSVRSFLGLGYFGRRVWFYHYLRDGLSEPARQFWDQREDQIREGLLGSGRFEQYFSTFRQRVLPLIHSQKTIHALWEPRSPEDQEKWYTTHWDSLRWRALFQVFFSKAVMARSGRSPEQFAHVKGAVSTHFLERARRALVQNPVQNCFLQWILTGEFFDLEDCHPYLSYEGHKQLQKVADRIQFVHGSFTERMLQSDPGRYSIFNCSDIFEYMNTDQQKDFYRAMLHVARPGSRLAFWNLLVPRICPSEYADRISQDIQRSNALHQQDRGFFYNSFHLETIA